MTAELVYDHFAAAFREVDFNGKAKTLFRDEDGREIVAIFENAKGAKFRVWMKFFSFG